MTSDKELPVGQSQSGVPGQERTAEQENVRARTTSPSQGENMTPPPPPFLSFSHCKIIGNKPGGSALLLLGLLSLLLPRLVLSQTGPVN